MDRPLSETLLRQLAAPLVEHSLRFEPFVPGADTGPIGALSLLGTLERVTRDHLEPEPAAEAPIEVETQPRKTSLARSYVPDPSLTARFGSEKKEYKPALRDPSVIQALLELQDQGEEPRTRPSVAHAAARASYTFKRSSPDTAPIFKDPARGRKP